MARHKDEGPSAGGRERRKLGRGFGWLAFLGVVLVIAGAVGLVYVGVATLTSMLLFGWLLLIGGVVGIGLSLLAGWWGTRAILHTPPALALREA